MSNKKVLIICQSIHHGNTMKVAEVIAGQLSADIKKPSELKASEIYKYDLIGFGSGIYNGKHHVSLFEFIESLEAPMNKKAFIFSTASICYKKMHESLRQELGAKGFDIVDEFICKGFSDYRFIKYFFGGLNKNRPNEADLAKAKDFAQKIGESF